LKGNTFSISQVYLKKKTRIEAFVMIMVLCLMIYSIVQRVTELNTENEGNIESEMMNLEDVNWKILSLMGEKCKNIYL
jgi:transposase